MNIKAPLKNQDILKLKTGERVLIDGTIYTARDLAHQKLIELIKQKKTLPVDLSGQVIFYAGPAPGAIGPTTASRMDNFLEPLLKLGVKATIGKGPRDKKVKALLKKYKSVYLIATGGAAALLGESVKSSEVVAFPELGPEAVHKLEVKNFPVIVAMDTHGRNIFERGLAGNSRD